MTGTLGCYMDRYTMAPMALQGPVLPVWPCTTSLASSNQSGLIKPGLAMSNQVWPCQSGLAMSIWSGHVNPGSQIHDQLTFSLG